MSKPLEPNALDALREQVREVMRDYFDSEYCGDDEGGFLNGYAEKIVYIVAQHVLASEAAAYERAAQHIPIVKTDPHEAWLVCSCGMESHGTGYAWADWWPSHIRALAAPSQSKEEK